MKEPLSLLPLEMHLLSSQVSSFLDAVNSVSIDSVGGDANGDDVATDDDVDADIDAGPDPDPDPDASSAFAVLSNSISVRSNVNAFEFAFKFPRIRLQKLT